MGASAKKRRNCKTLPGMTYARSCGVSPTVTNCKCLCRRARQVARGPVARLGRRRRPQFAIDGRRKEQPAPELRRKRHHRRGSGPEYGGFIRRTRKISRLSLVAFELSWVDAGRGHRQPASKSGWHPFTNAARRNKERNMSAALHHSSPAKTGNKCRAAFALTEPIPFVGVETRDARW